jgi:hypothetical protein
LVLTRERKTKIRLSAFLPDNVYVWHEYFSSYGIFLALRSKIKILLTITNRKRKKLSGDEIELLVCIPVSLKAKI